MNFPSVTRAEILITNNCNLSCSYCFEEHKDRKMSKETAKNVVDFLFKNASKSNEKVIIKFFGGEPLLNIDLINYIYDYSLKLSKKLKVKVEFFISTNATIFNKKIKEFIIKWKKDFGKINMQVSIDGMPHIQNKNRKTREGNPSSKFVEKFIKEINNLNLNLGEDVFPHSVITKNTLSDLFNIYKYFVDYGFEGFWYLLDNEEDWNKNDLKIFEKELIKIKNDIEKNNFKKSNFKNLYSKSNTCPSKTCQAGNKFVAIDTDGSIYPCHRFIKFKDKFKLSSINNFNSNKFNNNREPFVFHNRDDLFGNKSCENCDYKNCRRCLAVNYNKNKTLVEVPKEYCMMMGNVEYKIQESITGEEGR